MLCAKKYVYLAFESLAKLECFAACDSAANMCKKNIVLIKKDRAEMRADVIKYMAMDPKLSETRQVMQVFDNLAKAEVELHVHKGADTARLIRVTTKLRQTLQMTARRVAWGEGEPVSQDAKRVAEPAVADGGAIEEPPYKRSKVSAASGGAAGDFVDLTEEDD
jgi:hypothetical protein